VLADLDTGGGEHVDERRLAGIDVPVTIVETELSPAFMHRSVEKLRSVMPQARTVTLEGSSHVAILDARDEVLNVLRTAMGSARARLNRAG
jgi:pimeloyl-ACP methyl ester carboxylesterase